MSTKRNVRLRREYLYRKQVAGARARARHSTLHAARHAAGAMLYSPCCTHPHTRQLETNERVVYDKKRKLKQAIESGKPIPTELREEEAELRHQIEMDDANTEEVSVQCLCTGKECRSCSPWQPACVRANRAPFLLFWRGANSLATQWTTNTCGQGKSTQES